MASKFQIRSRGWNVGVALGCVALAVVGIGGLFVLQRSATASGVPTMAFLVAIGVVTFLLFAGPGIVYSARKRIPVLKRRLPGGTLPWIRAHLYLPILALTAAFVHAIGVPFRDVLSSGKVTLVLGVLVAISGVVRHHLIGLQKEALNLNASIGTLTAGRPRGFRRLVTDLTEHRRPRLDIDADAARLGPELREPWSKAVQLAEQLEAHFPRDRPQQPEVRYYKVWRALHAPMTIALFLVLGYHVWDVFGTTEAVVGDDKAAFASSAECADCHSRTFSEWGTSSMAHAQTSSITRAQLPITLEANRRIAAARGTPEVFEAGAETCVNCHAQLGARFAEEDDALLPLDAGGSEGGGREGAAVEGGGEAIQSDGVGCIVCHTQEAPPAERDGNGLLSIDTGGSADEGTQYGPLFEDPNPLPVRVHANGAGEDEYWDDPVASSQMCGACHNVKVDLDDDGVTEVEGVPERGGYGDAPDQDGDRTLDENEVDVEDDLVLQTTFDEWEDYLAAFDEPGFQEETDQQVDSPLSCTECHMPTEGDGRAEVVDHAPGVLPVPDRPYRSHSFVGVDYELDPEAYEEEGLQEGARDAVLAEREALLGSAVTLQVVASPGPVGTRWDADVLVRNNLLAHAFPTGFAFARQFWLEVSAESSVTGQPVCLVSPLPGVANVPCESGVVEAPDQDLPECDPAELRARGLPPTQEPVVYAQGASRPLGDCDPWLTNYQKVLTDGDEDGDGTFEEVPYQAFLPGTVKVRERVATGLPMNELQPVRLRDRQPADLGTYRYSFDASQVPEDEGIEVVARLRFRHLPPYFLRDLETRQDQLEGPLPEDARIDADALLEQLVVTDVVTAVSGQPPALACRGPQNEEGASILDCLDEDQAPVGLGAAAGRTDEEGPTTDGAGTAALPLTGVTVAAAVPALVKRRGRVRAALGVMLRRHRPLQRR